MGNLNETWTSACGLLLQLGRSMHIQRSNRHRPILIIYTVSQKKTWCRTFYDQLLTNFENSFTVGNGNKIYFSPFLKNLVTLPCET